MEDFKDYWKANSLPLLKNSRKGAAFVSTTIFGNRPGLVNHFEQYSVTLDFRRRWAWAMNTPSG